MFRSPEIVHLPALIQRVHNPDVLTEGDLKAAGSRTSISDANFMRELTLLCRLVSAAPALFVPLPRGKLVCCATADDKSGWLRPAT